jgi:hypothetical protein
VPLRSVAASAFICFYLIAATTAAVPSPAELASVTGERYSPDDQVSRRVRPTLDAIQRYTETATRRAWEALAEPRRIVYPPLTRLGLRQRWRMFAQPPRVNTSMAVRVVAQRPDGSPATAALVVLPQLGEDAFKGPSAYQAGFADKAVSNAIDAWSQLRARQPSAPDDALTRFGPDVLASIPRYFGARLAKTLPADARIVRTELWQGAAPMPRRGASSNGPKPSLDQLPFEAELGTRVRNGPSGWTLRRIDPPLR